MSARFIMRVRLLLVASRAGIFNQTRPTNARHFVPRVE